MIEETEKNTKLALELYLNNKKANDIKTPVEILVELSQSENENIRAAIALNKSTPDEIISFLSSDKSDYVQSCLAKRKIIDANRQHVHSSAIVSKNAKLGENVRIGPFTIIHDNVIIGDDTVIESHCELGHQTHNSTKSAPLIIGKNGYIRSHSIFYEDSIFGDNLVTGHRVTVREKTRAGDNLQIGTLSDIQGHCEIGDFVRFHSNVHIGQNSKIKNYVWIFPYVVLTNDPHPPSNLLLGVTIEDYVAIATMSVVLPGVTINEGALIGAHSSVAKDVAPNVVVAGSPAKFICETEKIKLKDGSNASAYPWRRHFHRGYLPEKVSEWIREFHTS